MTDQRYNELMEDMDKNLTNEEIEEGWHFCWEWDGLLVGPGMEDELEPCHCFENTHKVYGFRKNKNDKL